MENTGLILLAAGDSSRMGSPKQLLLYQGQTLLDRIVDSSIKAFDVDNIVLVLGADHEAIVSKIKNTDIRISINEEWKSGMASSIKLGLQTLRKNCPAMERCFISVCDQPYLSEEVFLKMLKMAKHSSKDIIAAEYAGTIGVPALFSKKYFEKLMNLAGDQGAKKIIMENMEDVGTFAFEEGATDIDTPMDYDTLITKK